MYSRLLKALRVRCTAQDVTSNFQITNYAILKNYDEKEIDLFLKQYRNQDYRVRSRRYNFEKKVPFLKNIKFKFWKNN